MGQAESVCQVLVQSNRTPMLRERVQSTRTLPAFSQPLQSQTIQEGQRLLLQIRVDGQSKCQVTWYKDNQPLRKTQDYIVRLPTAWVMRSWKDNNRSLFFRQIRSDNDVYILEIPRVSLRDAGMYLVKAVSAEGESQCSALMTIVPTVMAPEPMILSSTGQPPEFLQLFTDRKSSIGSIVHFEARIIGTHPLNVSVCYRFVGEQLMKDSLLFSRSTGYSMDRQSPV